VFDVDSIGLTNLVSRLNHGCDLGGQSIGAPARFHIGVSVNPSAPNLDDELRRFEYKVEAGAEFVVTWPVFDIAAWREFLKRIESTKLPVVAGLLPLESARHAEFIANEVPGTSCPKRSSTVCAAHVLTRLRQKGGDRARPGCRAARPGPGFADFDDFGADRRRSVRYR